jgi:allantoate deiminase
VTVISGCSRVKVVVSGEAGHAGTVPMSRRKDALAGAVEMIAAVERQARASADVVATVGVIEALPGAINVIPAEARFSIDLRASSDASRLRAIAAIEGELQRIAADRELGLALTPNYEAQATACDAGLIAALTRALERQGHRPIALPSGAGHDAMAMATLCPVVMLFVRCKGGISHNPAEAITVEDADAAIRVMLDFLLHYEVPTNKPIAIRMMAP